MPVPRRSTTIPANCNGSTATAFSCVAGVADPPEAIMDLKALLLDTDPLALIALGGFVAVLVVSLVLIGFVVMKMPKKGEKST